MTKWLSILLYSFVSLFRIRRDSALENLLLWQQLAVVKSNGTRVRLTAADRFFWILISKVWSRWRDTLHIVRPETVIRWHREGFRRHWTRKCRKRGRPPIDPKIRGLIWRMCESNPLWGSPRIHCELLKLGINVSEAVVSKYMIRDRKPPSQTWRTFLENHSKDIIARDFFTVPTATFRVLFVLIVLSHDRREILHTLEGPSRNMSTITTEFARIFRWKRMLRSGGPFRFPSVVLFDHVVIAAVCSMNTIDRLPRSPRCRSFSEST